MKCNIDSKPASILFMKRQLILFLFVVLLSPITFAQSITGKVTNEATGEPVPFVNIGILKLGMGTVSNTEGNYTLKHRKGEYKVLFSSIGYEVKEIPLAQLELNAMIKLTPKIEVLEEIEVQADKYGRDVILGHKLDDKGHSIGFSGRLLGTEIGAHIKVKKEIALRSAHFTVNFTGADSLLFRLNIYDFSDGKVGDKILKDNIIINAPQKRGTYDIDLTQYQLIIKNDVMLSLEWVEDDLGVGNQALMFRSKKSGAGNLFTKSTSFSDFVKLSDKISAAPKLKLGFYLKGVEE